MKLIALLSGGVDSTVMLCQLLDSHHTAKALSFDYGQRHAIELQHAAQIAEHVGVPWQVADLSTLQGFLGGSSQTSTEIPVPEGHYTDESMKVTVVPNRNMIMAAVAAAWAISSNFDGIAMAMHAGDHAIYPDCRPDFVHGMKAAMRSIHFTPVSFLAPFLRLTKAEIVSIGFDLEVPFDLTWSCYKGGAKHCGKCGTCVERREAFELAGVSDPTEYEDA